MTPPSPALPSSVLATCRAALLSLAAGLAMGCAGEAAGERPVAGSDRTAASDVGADDVRGGGVPGAALRPGERVRDIYWSDGDSGRINGVPFRLSDVDAPETGGVGAAVGGAKCERERELGFAAKAFVVEETRAGQIVVGAVVDVDRYDRVVVTLLDDDRDLGDLAVAAGHLRPWRWRNGRAVDPRPKWCP